VNVILTTLGTDGDVFPFLGLGRELRRRGHTVSLVTSGAYESLAVANGLQFHELISRQESEEVLGNPDFWHPLKAGPLAAKWGVRFLGRQYSLLSDLAKPERSVLVSNPGVLAARLLNERQRTPLVSIVLQPWIIPSIYKPPILPGGLSLPTGSPLWLWRLYFRALNIAGGLLVGRELNALRKTLGLPRMTRLFDWWLSPQCVLGLFPAWFGPPQPDWPPQIRLLSFPAFDGSDATLSPAIDAFLKDGDPPVAITFGTGVRHAANLYRAASDACALAGRRALILTKYSNQFPKPLPPTSMAVEFAPFSELFPRCAAVIHHGGIGTTAKAFAANVRQLVVPMCFDQLDNALRTESLGCGVVVRSRNPSVRRLSEKLRTALSLRVETPRDVEEPLGNLTLVRAAEIIRSFSQPPTCEFGDHR
jgi:UDP:flavonoid glycosyltransferase YjiC (YdhE family)